MLEFIHSCRRLRGSLRSMFALVQWLGRRSSGFFLDMSKVFSLHSAEPIKSCCSFSLLQPFHPPTLFFLFFYSDECDGANRLVRTSSISAAGTTSASSSSSSSSSPSSSSPPPHENHKTYPAPDLGSWVSSICRSSKTEKKRAENSPRFVCINAHANARTDAKLRKCTYYINSLSLSLSASHREIFERKVNDGINRMRNSHSGFLSTFFPAFSNVSLSSYHLTHKVTWTTHGFSSHRSGKLISERSDSTRDIRATHGLLCPAKLYSASQQ